VAGVVVVRRNDCAVDVVVVGGFGYVVVVVDGGFGYVVVMVVVVVDGGFGCTVGLHALVLADGEYRWCIAFL
jgi:hypothetical protein